MAKLNQIIAVEKGIKSRTYSEISELHKAAQKPELFNGFSKTYQPVDEEGEKLPGESKRVQFVATHILKNVERLTTELMTVTARKDWTNCIAHGTVTVDDSVIVFNAPVSYLLFMEKQLTDIRTFVACLPVLDSTEDWTLDANAGIYKSNVTQTHRTKKVQRPIVLYAAMPEHPAQTQMITDDVLAGYWSSVKQSGALPATEKQALLARVDKLLRAIKDAREAANMNDEIESPNVGAAVFNYLLKE